MRKSRGGPSLWKWTSRAIIFVGVIWVVVLLSRDFETLRAGFQVASVAWLVFTVFAGVAALLLSIPVFRTILSAYSKLEIRYAYAARMLFVAQMLRHLPGRIWGHCISCWGNTTEHTRRSNGPSEPRCHDVCDVFHSADRRVVISGLVRLVWYTESRAVWPE